jgi:hypothetical protein
MIQDLPDVGKKPISGPYVEIEMKDLKVVDVPLLARKRAGSVAVRGGRRCI